jgi:hypothetical protein
LRPNVVFRLFLRSALVERRGRKQNGTEKEFEPQPTSLEALSELS